MNAKKSLGQHFLTSEKIVREVVNAAYIQPTDTVVEVGPGKGILTRALLERAQSVIAIEADADMVSFLSETCADAIAEGRLTLIHGDITRIPFSDLIKKERKYTLVANIPYYITGEILKLFLSYSTLPKRVVLMVQKEVADRVVARDGKESVLSISVKTFGTPRKIRNVPRAYFKPAPEVDSAILSITNLSSPFSSGAEEKVFFTVLKKGFSQKRKRVIKNLALDETIARACEISNNMRAEEMTPAQWLCLSSHVQ